MKGLFTIIWIAMIIATASAVSITGVQPTVEGACINDVFNLNTGGNLGCTANDIQLASVTDNTLFEQGKTNCQTGEVLTFTATYEVLLTAQSRYDVGLYFGINQDNALSGTCAVGILPVSGDAQEGVADLDQDGCGDISNKQSNPVFVRYTLSTVCQDTDGDGIADLPYCSTWRQRSRDLCNSEAESYPGAPSKCLCSTLPLLPICTPCTISGPAEVTRTCGSSFAPVDGDVTVTGDCTLSAPVDEAFSGNCGVFKRTWTIQDPCEGEKTFTQDVRVIDDSAPMITCPGPVACPSATSTDNCDDNPSVSLTGKVAGELTYTAEDSCGNTFEKKCPLECQ